MPSLSTSGLIVQKMDQLSKLLTLLRPSSHSSGRFDLGCDQAVLFPDFSGMKCYSVVAGCCWLQMPGEEAVGLQEGDCFVITGGTSFRLATSLNAPDTPFESVFQALQKGLSGLYDGEPACTLAGGHFLFEGAPTDLLFGLFPSFTYLSGGAERAAMRWALDQMRDELQEDKLASSFIVQQLAYVILAHALRIQLSRAPSHAMGWIYAMTDPQLSTAIRAIQEEPARAWDVESLAQFVGMSRSAFALRFKNRVGEGPIEFLTKWRMLLAGHRIQAGDEAVLPIALSLGYETESSFGKAFKRVMGCSPRLYKSQQKHQLAHDAGAPA